MKKILLKLSGESLSGDKEFGIDRKKVLEIVKEIKECLDLGFSISIVIGGGNFWRGKDNSFISFPTTDYIGMLATVMNALILEDMFKQMGINAKVLSAIEMNKITDFYKRDNYLDNEVIIFAAGTSNPCFSTDTAAALRAKEINAEILVKATNVDGIYDKDPKVYNDAKLIKETTYYEVLSKKLKVMDLTAITLCMDNSIPIKIFNMNKKGMLKEVLTTDNVGSIVR